MKHYKLVNKARFVSSLMILVFIVSFGLLLKQQSVQGENIPKYKTVVIQNGDTLWNIAEKYNTSYNDLREFIYVIKKENNIFGDLLTPNDIIKIPVA